ncbi:MAG: AAA-associated domain-containing protein [Thaumarchaeota archaeon]|nr:AAA-associated domain-containing protein [Nitrososphaerota archaeon]
MTIPRVQVGNMIGLLEVLQDFKGKVDLAKVADELRLELDDILPAVDAAKLLHMLQVDSGDLILTDEGRMLLSKSAAARKRMLNKMLASSGEFKAIIDFIRMEHGGEVTKEELVGFLKDNMPDVDPEQTFSWIVEWGRYALLLRYDSDNGKIKTVHKTSTGKE